MFKFLSISRENKDKKINCKLIIKVGKKEKLHLKSSDITIETLRSLSLCGRVILKMPEIAISA